MKKSLLLLAFTCLLCNLSAQFRDTSNVLPDPWWSFPAEKAKPKYRITNTKLVGWSVCAWGGLVDGVLEGYGFDGRRSFERKFGVDKYGYFGSRSWAKAYPDKNPQNPIKPASRVFGAWDFYHHADKMRKVSYLSGGVVVGIGGAKTNQKWWHYAIDFGVSFAVSGATKAAGMYWIRND
jgi:hypothetical protein